MEFCVILANDNWPCPASFETCEILANGLELFDEHRAFLFAVRRHASLHPQKLDSARRAWRVMDAMDLRLEIIVLCLEDVLHPGLRISVDEGEPRTLDLNHYAMTGFESVVHVAQGTRDAGHLPRYEWFRLFHIVAESTSHHTSANQLLAPALIIVWYRGIGPAVNRFTRELVNQLDDDVRRLPRRAKG